VLTHHSRVSLHHRTTGTGTRRHLTPPLKFWPVGKLSSCWKIIFQKYEIRRSIGRNLGPKLKFLEHPCLSSIGNLHPSVGKLQLLSLSKFLSQDTVECIMHLCNCVIKRWRFGSVGNVVGRINEVNQRRAQLVLGWVTVCRRVNHLCM